MPSCQAYTAAWVRSEVQLIQQVGDVAFDRLFADDQRFGDLVVALPAAIWRSTSISRSVSSLNGLIVSRRSPLESPFSSLTMRAATRGLSTAHRH